MRHQRNTDAYFDVYDKSKRNGISELALTKVYDILETMLPESHNGNLSLVEIFGESSKPRNGWVSFTEREA